VHRQILGLAAIVFTLSACGGGSGNNALSDQQPDISTVLFSGVESTLPQERWSDAATWGGSVPEAGSRVLIPADKRIVLDTSIDVAGLTIDGSLECADQDLSITSGMIMVHGELVCGSREKPFTHQLDITLTGDKSDESTMGMGTKVIGAMGGGRISLHGESRTSWLMLDETALAGAQTIRTDRVSAWRVGDRIVITSTADDMNQAEVRRIAAIDGRTITLDTALDHRHFGEVQSFSNGKHAWTLDSRAEVALLSRNIRIQGDESSEASRFGGHMMIMEGSVGLLSGIEMYRMGQEGVLARYPFHWHLAGNVGGQYIKNSSIVRSYNRCITVHGSHNASIDNNVCMDHVGHGFFLEDGVETGNVFNRNLGLLTRKPAADVALVPSDIQTGDASRGPSTFWISNGDNTFTDNTVAGSDGLGFWYDTPESPTGASAQLPHYKEVVPINSVFGEFKNNRVHSSSMSFSSCSEGSGPLGYAPPTEAIYEKLTVFSGGNGAVWPCEGDQMFQDLIISDSGEALKAGFVSPRPMLIRDSLFVANSALSADGSGRQRSAIGIYDYGGVLQDVHFVNYNEDYGPSYVFGARDAAVRHTGSRVERATFENGFLLYDLRKPINDVEPSQWGAVIHDVDGSFGYAPDSALVSNHPMMTDTSCSLDVYGEGRLCQNRYGYLSMGFPIRQNLPPLIHYRSDGIEVSAQPLAPRARYQSIVSVNHDRYYYGYKFDQSLIETGSLRLIMRFLHDGDTAVLQFQDLPAHTVIASEDYVAASSLADLRSGAGDRYFHDGQSLYLKMQAQGEAWDAGDRIDLSW